MELEVKYDNYKDLIPFYISRGLEFEDDFKNIYLARTQEEMLNNYDNHPWHSGVSKYQKSTNYNDMALFISEFEIPIVSSMYFLSVPFSNTYIVSHSKGTTSFNTNSCVYKSNNSK